MADPNFSAQENINYGVILYLGNHIPNATEHLRKLEQRVASEQRTSPTILNRLGYVKQKLEKDQPKMLDQENDAALPMVIGRGEAKKKKTMLQIIGKVGVQDLRTPRLSPYAQVP